MKPGTEPTHESVECRAVNDVLSRVGDKWSVLIISMLGPERRRFNELKRMVAGISQRMLTLSLRGLERDGIVKRTVTPSTPPRVDYELTPLGRSLLGTVNALSQWAIDNRAEIEKARKIYDAQER